MSSYLSFKRLRNQLVEAEEGIANEEDRDSKAHPTKIKMLSKRFNP